MTLMFCITRNLYDVAPATLESLFQTNQNVERVYLFIEDDEFPYELDPRVRVVNLDKMTPYLSEKSPNYNTVFSRMSFVRCYASKYLLEDKVLYVDIDTLFIRDISELWNTDFEGNLLCVVPEDKNRGGAYRHVTREYSDPYFNTGVCLLNLKALRDEGMDDEVLEIINTCQLPYPDQDALNIACKGRVKYISNRFNNCRFTGGEPGMGAIIHTTPFKAWDKNCVHNKLWTKYDGWKKKI